VVIQSDGDLLTAIASFIEVAGSDLPPKFYISECTEVMLQDERCEPLEPYQAPHLKKEEALHQHHLLKG